MIRAPVTADLERHEPLAGAPDVVMRNCIRARRLDCGWTQQDLADELGVSRQTVNSIETERNDPSLPLAFEIAATFECTIEQIFGPGASA